MDFLPIILGVAAVVAAVVIYYFTTYLPAQKIELLMTQIHFRKDRFKKDVRPSTFEYYDNKVTKLVIVFGGVLGAVVVPAVIGLPPPYNIITTIMALIGAAMVSLLYRQQINATERERNINKPYGSMITYYPGEGDVDELWRRMVVETEVIIGDKEKEVIVDEIIEGIKTLPSYDSFKKEFDSSQKDKKKKDRKHVKITFEEDVRAIWTSNIGRFHIYRLKVKEGYGILYITPNNLAESKTKNTRPMLDETQWVNVNMIPAFNLYCDTTRKIFETIDEEGRPAFGERTMGVYVNLYNIKSRDEDLMKGGHTALSKTDQLLAAHIHLYDQRQTSSRQMTKNLRDLEKTNIELEERQFNEQAAAAEEIQNIGNLLKDLNISTTSTISIEDNGTIALILSIGFAIGAILMYVMLLLGAAMMRDAVSAALLFGGII